MSFAGKNVLITGGSSGIGKATAKQLAAAGAHLFIVARDVAKIDATVEELRALAMDKEGQAIAGFSADVSQYEPVCDVVRQLVEAGRVPDYLFNFAGIAHPGYFHELPLQVFRDTMNINFFGTVHMCKAVAPLMMARHSGHIINTSSVAGFLGVFGYTAYGASKFAVRGFTDVLRSELKPYGVKVSILFPPDTDTPQLWAENRIKPAETKALAGNVKVMSPDQVAKELLQGVERGRYIIIPGLESKLVYMAAGVLGSKIHAFFDPIIRKVQQERGGPPEVKADFLPCSDKEGGNNGR